MKKLKDICKSSLISIMISTCIFVIVGVIFDIIGKGTFVLEEYRFSLMAGACVITGLGFGVPTVLYSVERIPRALASSIHLGIGFAVYFTVATLVGWIPIEAGLIWGVVTVVASILVGLVIWFLFMRYNRKLAEKMNRAIAEKKI